MAPFTPSEKKNRIEEKNEQEKENPQKIFCILLNNKEEKNFGIPVMDNVMWVERVNYTSRLFDLDLIIMAKNVMERKEINRKRPQKKL